ncbi:MAG: DUF433 domain-containing protein [Planctomycetota bacterium]
MSLDSTTFLSRDPNVLGGAAVFAGTRVPVESLLAHLRAGDDLEAFLSDFPTVTRDQAVAALNLAAELLSQPD